VNYFVLNMSHRDGINPVTYRDNNSNDDLSSTR